MKIQQIDPDALTHVTGGLFVSVRSGSQGAPQQPQMQPGGGGGGGPGSSVRVRQHGGGHVNISIRQG
jgi:hypothetical protein